MITDIVWCLNGGNNMKKTILSLFIFGLVFTTGCSTIGNSKAGSQVHCFSEVMDVYGINVLFLFYQDGADIYYKAVSPGKAESQPDEIQGYPTKWTLISPEEKNAISQ
jgi:hypothetical protein